MPKTASINLFQTKANLPANLLVWDKYLRIASYVGMALLLGGGIIVWGLFIVIGMQRQTLEDKRAQASAYIKSNVVKEGMILALRQRIKVVTRIMEQQVSLAPYINTTLLIAQPPKLASFTMGEQGSVNISIRAADGFEAQLYVKTLIDLVAERKVKKPMLTSLVVERDGSYMLSFSYGVIL